MALSVTSANDLNRAQADHLTEAVQSTTGEHVEPAFVDQGSTVDVAEEHGIELHVVKFPEAKQGFVFLPRR